MTGRALVVVDMQQVFGDPASPWFTPRFTEAEAVIAGLLPSFGRQAVFTRFVAPEQPDGAWIRYYEQWPFALVPADDPLYDQVLAFRDTGHPVVSLPAFGKWGPELREAIGDADELVLTGVSTDCCVLSTALAAADAGLHVLVVADACAGASDADHRRALDAMALYAPLIEIVSSSDLADA
ncbi:cysteine hydrolase [Leifsonia shinshuensis]|uniref:cysteine hydrolase family protein n=1 Tax=Leifsonia shinshuensis TaxID=150026 RepID=UPI001F512A85|nr:isochorismatase family cysteine hydrolase [Leifsonia shinshuensis]MCI0159219.1 cysteine hydrolase [Leifsonia shinshuensis]